MFGTHFNLFNNMKAQDFYSNPPKENFIEESKTFEDPLPSKKRKRSRALTTTLLQNNPSWLPLGWRVEQKVRSSGRSKGATDKYYVEPTYGRRLRSRKEVDYFLEHGVMPRKRQPPSTPNVSKLQENNSVVAPATPPNVGFCEGSSKQPNKNIDSSYMEEQWSMLISKLKNRLDVKLINPLVCDL